MAKPDEVQVGDQAIFKEFGGCRIVHIFEDGSVDLQIPGLLGLERVPHGDWQPLEPKKVVPSPVVLKQTESERHDLEEQDRRRLRDETDEAMEAILRESTLQSCMYPEIDEMWRSPSAANKWLSFEQEQGKRNHQVWLHIYDLDSVTRTLNDYGLRALGIGAFHCGVEVLGQECFFSWVDGAEVGTGVILCEPKTHQVHVFKESVDMGKSPLTTYEIKTVITNAMDDWPGNSYHIVNKNCVHFTEDLLRRLQVTEPFPTWVRGAPDAGQHNLVQPIVNWGWGWMKYYYSEPAPAEDDPSTLSCCCYKPRKNLVEDAAGEEIRA